MAKFRVGKMILGVVALAALMLLVLLPTAVSTTRGFVCANTASMFSYREWPLGIRTNFRKRASPLERFVANRWPGTVKNRWVPFSGTGRNIFGSSVSYSDGGFFARGALRLMTGNELETWISRHSEAEVRELYHFLEKASPDESEKRAKEIIAEVSQ